MIKKSMENTVLSIVVVDADRTDGQAAEELEKVILESLGEHGKRDHVEVVLSVTTAETEENLAKLRVALFAFHISMEIFEKKLYETSVQELDYYVQSVREGLEEIEDKSYEMSMDTEVQSIFSDLKQMGPAVSEYNRALTRLRWRLANENNSRSAIRTIRYTDSYGTVVESAAYSWEIPEETFEEFAGIIGDSNGEAVFYGPTKECRYLLCGRKIRKWDDASLDELGSVVLICDVGQIIAKNKEQLEAGHASLFVYSEENMIYQDLEELPPLPDRQDGHMSTSFLIPTFTGRSHGYGIRYIYAFWLYLLY